MTNELKSCPFCGAGQTIIQENKGVWRGTGGYGEPVSVEVRHWCEPFEGISSRVLAFVGKDEAKAVARWNHRYEYPEPAK